MKKITLSSITAGILSMTSLNATGVEGGAYPFHDGKYIQGALQNVADRVSAPDYLKENYIERVKKQTAYDKKMKKQTKIYRDSSQYKKLREKTITSPINHSEIRVMLSETGRAFKVVA